MTTTVRTAAAAGKVEIDSTLVDASDENLPYIWIGIGFGFSSGDTELRNSIIHPIDTIELRFQALTQQWQRATAAYSLASQKAMHPAYLQIIAMGKPVIPLILKELGQKGGHWYIALESLNEGESPVSRADSGNIRKMKQAWLDWGRVVGHV